MKRILSFIFDFTMLNTYIFQKCVIENVFFFQARHIYICEHHKNMIQSVRSKRKRKDSDDETEMTEVRFMMFICCSGSFFFFFFIISQSSRALRLLPS